MVLHISADRLIERYRNVSIDILKKRIIYSKKMQIDVKQNKPKKKIYKTFYELLRLIIIIVIFY